MEYISYAPQLSGVVARHSFQPQRHIQSEAAINSNLVPLLPWVAHPSLYAAADAGL